jgi:hypothetical protein
MNRTSHCARPGCGAPAAALLRYDYASRTVWLDPPSGQREGTTLGMCAAHADGLKVPVGWSSQDQRRSAATEPAAIAV